MDTSQEKATTREISSSDPIPRTRRGNKRPPPGPVRETRLGRRTRRRLEVEGGADPQPSTQPVILDAVVGRDGSGIEHETETSVHSHAQEDSVARDEDDEIVVTHRTSRFLLPLRTSIDSTGHGIGIERTGDDEEAMVSSMINPTPEDPSPSQYQARELVSSRSLSLILNDDQEIRPLSQTNPTPSLIAGTATSIRSEDASQSSHSFSKGKGKQKAEERAPTPEADPSTLADYTCPICFSPPTNATLTPCGHICCGSCLFAAVKTSMKRAQFAAPEDAGARCPVCRASIPGWDGKGGGVIGLKIRALFTL